jgi:hypothetical protein
VPLNNALVPEAEISLQHHQQEAFIFVLAPSVAGFFRTRSVNTALKTCCTEHAYQKSMMSLRQKFKSLIPSFLKKYKHAKSKTKFIY